jgi:hypothetical protein
MANRYSEAARQAAAMTDNELQDELDAIKKSMEGALEKLIPTKKEQKAFRALMEKINAETNTDKQMALLRDNLEVGGKTAIKLLSLLV